MESNCLKLNDDKTHLVIMSTQHSRAKSQSANLVELTTPTKTIKPSNTEKLLGCWIQEDLKWTSHLRDSENSLFKSLNQRLGTINLMSKLSDFKTRKMLANGIFISKITYLITVWSSCTKDLMQTLQNFQNNAARLVTKNDWSIENKQNLRQIGWLSVN